MIEIDMIDSAQVLLDRKRPSGGLQALLRETADEIEKIGPITIFDFTIQGLRFTQNDAFIQEGTYFTYRKDDHLLNIESRDTGVSVTKQNNGNIALMSFELNHVSGPYNYPKLLNRLSDELHTNSNVISIYFDHKSYENVEFTQNPYLLVALVK